MTFWNWLAMQRDRTDVVGDFARDARKDPSWPSRASGYDTLEMYLETQGATESALEVFAEAHRQWQRGTVRH